jgi:hypothetical protein
MQKKGTLAVKFSLLADQTGCCRSFYLLTLFGAIII